VPRDPARAQDLEARAGALEQAVLAARAEVKAANAEVKALEVDLESKRVLAPMAGTVVNKPPEIGELVGVDLGGSTSENDQQVVELADFSTLMVETDIPEGRLHMVKLGSPCVVVLDAFPSRRYRGEAVEVDPKVDRAKATVGVKVKLIDEHEGVLPDMSARVSFLSAPIDPAQLAQKPKTLVPESAVTERSGSKVVFEIEEDVVRMRNVALGESLGGGFELQSGPPPGTRVVADPPETLRDGQKVKEKS
jgi:RND family efflux transporter MFP subunit